MAIELDVKLRNPLPLAELLQRVTATLLAWFGAGIPRIEADGSAELAAEGAAARLAIDGVALVSILSISAGPEAVLGDEGGLWSTFSAGELRTPESLFLACVAAGAAAQIARGHVVDEAGLVSLERESSPEDFTARLKELAGGKPSFKEGAAAFDSSFESRQ